MPRKHTPIRDLFVNTETTRSEGSNAKVWACSRCGWELVDNATRFARHITRCPSATDADRAVAREHLARMAPEQIQAINDNAEFTRAFSLGGKAHVRNLFEDTNTTRAGEKAKLFRCRRCGLETTENATRFAQHILKCEKATDEDRSVAGEHEALTEKRRQMRRAKQTQGQGPQDGGEAAAGPCCPGLKEENVLLELSWEENEAAGECSFDLRDLQLSAAAHLPEPAVSAPPPALAHAPIDLTHGTSADFASMLGTLLEEPGITSGPGTSGPKAAFEPPIGNAESPFMSFGGEVAGGIPELVPSNGSFSAAVGIAGAAAPAVGLEAFADLFQGDLPGLPQQQQQQQQQPCVPELDEGLSLAMSQGLEDMVRGLSELQGTQQHQQHQQQDFRGGGGNVVGGLQPMDLGKIHSEGNGAAVRMRSSASGSCGHGDMGIGASSEGSGLGMTSGHDGNGDGEAAGLEVVQCIQQKRRRAAEGTMSVVGLAGSEGEATPEEWQEFLAWKEARAAARPQLVIPRAVATNSMLFEQLRAYFVGHAKECTSIYNASTKAYGPPGSRALVGAQLRSRFHNLMSVQKTLVSCCHLELFRFMQERVRKEPGMFLDLTNAVYSCSKEIVAVGSTEMIARRAPLVPTMDKIERAVYNCISKSFEELSLTEDETKRNKHLELMDEVYRVTVKNGADMRNLVISLVASSSRNQRMTPSDGDMSSSRSDADSGSSWGTSMDNDHQDEHLVALWQRLINEGLPFLDEMCSSDEAALASSAWMSELCEVVGWENAMAMFT